jgi:transcriptional regulator with XRE-family HTH domain
MAPKDRMKCATFKKKRSAAEQPADKAAIPQKLCVKSARWSRYLGPQTAVRFESFVRLREALNVTTDQLAALLGIPRRTLSKRKQDGTFNLSESNALSLATLKLFVNLQNKRFLTRYVKSRIEIPDGLILPLEEAVLEAFINDPDRFDSRNFGDM